MRNFSWCLVFVILILNFFFINGMGALDAKAWAFIALPFILFWSGGTLTWLSLLPSAFAIISLVLMPDSRNGYFQTAAFSAGCAYFSIFCTAKIDHNLIKKALAWTCLIQSISILVNVVGFDVLEILNVTLPVHELPGLLGNRGFTCAAIACTLPFVFEFKGLTRSITIFLAFAALSFIAFFGTLTPLAVAVVYLSVRFIPRHLCRPSYIYSLAGAFLLSYSDGIRYFLWVKVPIIPDVLFGKGFGWIPDHAGSVFRINAVNGEYSLHNEFLEVFVALGILAVPIYVIAIRALRSNSSTHWFCFANSLLLSISWPAYHVPIVAIAGLYSAATLLRERYGAN